MLGHDVLASGFQSRWDCGRGVMVWPGWDPDQGMAFLLPRGVYFINGDHSQKRQQQKQQQQQLQQKHNQQKQQQYTINDKLELEESLSLHLSPPASEQ